MSSKGYPALWTRPVEPHDMVTVQVLAEVERGRFTGHRQFNVRTAQDRGALIFTAAEDDLLCLHDGEDAGDCIIGGAD